MFIVTKYKTESGKCPFDEYIKELKRSGDIQSIVKIQHYISLLEELGDAVLENSTWAKRIDENLFELRPKANRILYFMCAKNGEYVLLHCFKKKTQKTPLDEKEKAKNEAADYERRIKNE